jgi:hypothetical protein
VTEFDTLVARIRATLDLDEQIAKAATPGPWTTRNLYRPLAGCRCLTCEEDEPYAKTLAEVDVLGDDPTAVLNPGDAEHMARYDPARVIAAVAALREVLDICVAELGGGRALHAALSALDRVGGSRG